MLLVTVLVPVGCIIVHSLTESNLLIPDMMLIYDLMHLVRDNNTSLEPTTTEMAALV